MNILGECLAQCPEGQTPVGDSRVCTPCSNQCGPGGCDGTTPKDCTKCASVLLKDGETCAASCPRLEFALGGTQCADCDPECASGCSGPSALECAQGRCKNVKKYNGACASDCWSDRGPHPAGYFPANEGGEVVCRPCDTMCGAGATSCCFGAGTVERTAAQPGRTCGYLDPSFEDSGAPCRPCDEQCRGCTGPGPSKCLTCAYAKYQGKCVAACPRSMVRGKDGVCAPCPDGTISDEAEER
eukprot:UC1_evm1s760